MEQEKMMKIGVVGYGTVGKAVADGFTEKGFQVYINDEKKGYCTSEEQLVIDCDVIFICVSTPPLADGGCDLSQVYKANSDLWQVWRFTHMKRKNNPIIVIKRTVIPGALDILVKDYPLIASNPSFIRHQTPLKDFLNPHRIIIGTHELIVFEKLKALYESWDCPKIHVTPTEAEVIKYLSNALIVTKVAFANEMAKVCKLTGAEPTRVFNGLIHDSRFAMSHLDPEKGLIPHNHQCLPKDTRALIRQLELLGHDSKLLKAAYETGIECEGE